MISNSSYNIPMNSLVYVVVDGATSQQISWPNYNNYNYNSYNNYNYSQISFSQNNISVGVGQSTTVTLYGGYNNSYYVSSDSSLVGTGIIGNILSIYGNANGTTNLTICSGSNNCGNLYITVYGNSTYYYPQYQYSNYQYSQYYPNYQYQYSVSLSQNSLNLRAGQNSSITVYGNGSYYISNSSNPNIASASINGNNLNVYAYNAGSSNITVCQNYGTCAVLYISVANNNQYPNNYYHSPGRQYPIMRPRVRFF